MTRHEIDEFLKGSMFPSLEQAGLDLGATLPRVEEHLKDLKREKEARMKAEKTSTDKEKTLADKDAEIACLSKEVEDAGNTKASITATGLAA